jgi:hypothetical protein
MKYLVYVFLFLANCNVYFAKAQQLVYSDYSKEDNRDINFEIVGKMNNNIIIYKNIRWKHNLTILGNDMKLVEKIDLDFIPEKTFNVDFISYPNFFYIIYQYQKRNVLYCMGIKMDGSGKKITEPAILDTTQMNLLADNKIYSTIHSEDKQKIAVFKVQKKYEKFSLTTVLLNNDLGLINKTRFVLPYEDRKENYSNFLVDNQGNFIFTKDVKQNFRDNSTSLSLIQKNFTADTLSTYTIELEKKLIDEVNLKIDNLNNRYVINTLYYPKGKNAIEGLFNFTWDNATKNKYASSFVAFNDTLRDEAKGENNTRFAFDDFFIRETIVKKDGGFLVTSEDFTTQTRGGANNPFNRFDYLNNYNSFYNSGYYYQNPLYGYYRPFNSFGNQSTRYYFANILIQSYNKNGQLEWSRVIHKDQFDDDNDNYLSFGTLISGGEIYFLFNNDKNKNQIISNQSITANGELKRNTTLKSFEKGYQFMPKLSKQIGTKQIIIPCTYRGYICFAKVDLQ